MPRRVWRPAPTCEDVRYDPESPDRARPCGLPATHRYAGRFLCWDHAAPCRQFAEPCYTDDGGQYVDSE